MFCAIRISVVTQVVGKENVRDRTADDVLYHRSEEIVGERNEAVAHENHVNTRQWVAHDVDDLEAPERRCVHFIVGHRDNFNDFAAETGRGAEIHFLHVT
jgi:hypothetical protein